MSRLRFGLERLVLRGLHFRLLLALGIVLTVALIGGSLAMLLGSGFSDFSDAAWWAFLRLTDPGYLGEDEGASLRVVSVVVTILGYLIFLGLLIAILTQWLDETVSRLQAGLTPIAVSGHVVILGWTERTPTIVYELLGTRNRLQRFLEQHDKRELKVVILAEHVDEALAQELREQLGSLWSDRRVLLRSGTPLRRDHLERVAYRDAAVLILPGAEFIERNPEIVDAETIKTLVAISTFARSAGTVPPPVVAELCHGERANVARRAYAGVSEIVATDDMMSRLLAQSLHQPGLCSVFSELLTLNKGNTIYVRNVDELAGARFGDARARVADGIPIGRISGADRQLTLNPDPNIELRQGDLLVFIARSYHACAPGPEIRNPGLLSSAAPSPPHPVIERAHRLLILGWSRKLPTLLRELAGYGEDVFEIDVVSRTTLSEREQLLARQGIRPSARVRHIELGFTAPGVLERLDPQRYDQILVLASELLAETDQADATTVFTYQVLTGLLPEDGPRPQLLIELQHAENLELFPTDQDVIVSPLLVSYLLAQVSLRHELAAVYEELCRPWGAQILLYRIDEYMSTDKPACFGDLEMAAAGRGEIALGLRHGPNELRLNPGRDFTWTPATTDHAVVLTRYAEQPEPQSGD
mgnify:FL=1